MNQPRGRGICIAEKSSLKKKLEAVYKDILHELPFTLDFECFAGHVVEQARPADYKPEWAEWKKENLPMIPTDWKYLKSSIDNKAKRYDQVMAQLERGGYDFIINAGDPEREGQLIQDAFFSTMSSNLKATPIFRMWFNDEKPETLAKAMKNPLGWDDNIPNGGTVRHLSQASILRARLDWLIGLNSTQLLTLKAGGKVRVGRVQTPILNIIVEREKAIRNFKVQVFWTLRAIFKHANGEYVGTLLDEEGKPIQFLDKAKAEALAAEIAGAVPATITSKTIKTVNENAPRFYSTGSLQGDAAKVFGITMNESLGALQYLYEREITSYPRTDSDCITVAMAQDMADTVRTALQVPKLSHIKMPPQSAFDALAKNKNYANDENVRAHTALLPLQNISIDFNTLTGIQQDVLYLIARSTILPLLGPIVKQKTELITSVGDYKFKTNGSIVLEEGWSKEVPEYTSKDAILPEVNEGDAVEVSKYDLAEGKTKPPQRYNPHSMRLVLENVHRLLEDDESKLVMKRAEGLGRPSTRTSILEGLRDSGYIQFIGKKQEFEALDFGIEVIDALGTTPLTSPILTATWESKLQDLEDGKISFDELYGQIVEYTHKSIESLDKLSFDVKGAAPEKKVLGFFNGNEVYESKAGYYCTDFMKYRRECDAAKENGTEPPSFYGFYLGKKLDNDSMKMTGSISPREVEKLLAGQRINKEFTWKKRDNAKSNVELELDENGRLKFVKADGPKVDERQIGQYKVTRLTGTKNGKNYDIYKFDEPNFIVGVDVFGYQITWEDLAQLINGETLERTLKNKSGQNVARNLKLFMGEGIKATAIDSQEEKVSAHVTRITRDGKIFYRLDNGVYVQSTICGHTWTIDELETVYAKGEIYLTGLIAKSKKTFDAKMVVDGNSLNFSFD